MDFLLEVIFAPLYFLFDTQKRLYWGYLLTSVLLIFVFYKSLRIDKKNYFNRSSLVDLGWLLTNQWLFKLFIVPLFALQIHLALSIHTSLTQMIGEGRVWAINQTLLTLLFALVLFLFDDFCKFFIHLCMHRIPFLWSFHAIHHSATSLTPLTLYRIHPVELLINSTRSFLVGGIISGLFLYFFSNQISLYSVLGVNVFVFIFNLAGSNLRHSPFYLGFGRWEKYFISPAQHQIHHSVEPAHFNHNFGSALAIWDALFNCLLLSKAQQVEGVGLNKKGINRQTLKQQWWGIRNP